VEALMAFQVRLCIPQETVDAAHTEICGQLFEKVILNSFCGAFLFISLSFMPYVVAMLMACSVSLFLHLFGHITFDAGVFFSFLV